MLADLLMALKRGRNQFQFWRQTYSPLSRWKAATDEVIEAVREEARRYGIEDAQVDRRRAYQIARMTVPNRHGDHVVDLLPNAYWHYAPTSKATVHSGRKQYPTIAERRAAFMSHPQTLAYLMTPPELARLGIGGSADGGIVVLGEGESEVDKSAVAQRLWKATSGQASKAVLERFADVLARLSAGPVAEAGEDDSRAA